MRYIFAGFVALGLLFLASRLSSLSTTAQSLLVLGAAGMFAYYLWNGFRSGTMEAPGVGYMAGERGKNPFLFWFCAVFNAGMMITAMVAAVGLAGVIG
jgi:hypothetical protein